MLTRPGKSKAEVKAETICHEAEARVRPKNSEANSEARDVPLVIKKHRLRTHIKFINTKKLHTVSLWQSQQCQCTIQKLTSIEYYNKASNNFLSEKNVT